MARLGRIMVGQIARADHVTQIGHWEKGRLGLLIKIIQGVHNAFLCS
jgi:hypothetical protein